MLGASAKTLGFSRDDEFRHGGQYTRRFHDR